MKKYFFLLPGLICMYSFQPEKKDVVYAFNVKTIEKSMSLIPAGQQDEREIRQDLPYMPGPDKIIYKIDSFYLCKYEVSNEEYLFFINDIRKTDTTLYRAMLPDTNVWIQQLNYNEPYQIYYFRHPAYAKYPVVGVSHKQAEQYCVWLTAKYHADSQRKFKKAVFRLPSRVEWKYAAMNGGNREIHFPWAGPLIQNKKGEWPANFRVVSQAELARVEYRVQNVYGKMEIRTFISTCDQSFNSSYYGNAINADVTAPVKSYYPGFFGLYNMAGNVEEFVQEESITKGGSWHDTGAYLLNNIDEPYDTSNPVSCERGFRIAMQRQE